MPLKDRFIEAYNALVPAGWRVNFREAAGAGIDPDEADWRPLSQDSRRDLPLMTQERMAKVAHWLWEQNPLANRIVELPIAYLLAEGVQLRVEDVENQRVLDRFWRDPINEMDVKLPKKVRELAIFGEQLYPLFVDATAGTVRLGYLDPILIGEVVKDPDNPEQTIGVVTKRDAKGRYRKFRVVVNGPESVFTRRTQAIRQSFSDGDAFFFRVNDLSAGSRGRSDLLHVADYLDLYDQFVYGEAERYKLLRAFVWDLELRNADQNAVTKRAREVAIPKSGGVYVHNDSETLEPKTADLKAGDTRDGARLLRNHVLGGATIPEHWYAEGGDVNRATAGEMGDPAFKILAMRQAVWKHILESMGRYALMIEARAKGKESDIDWGDPAWNVQAVFPELTNRNLKDNATALQQIIAACGVALDRKLITRKLALNLINTVSGRLGIEIDADAELKAAEAEAAKDREDDVFVDPPEGGGAAPDNQKENAK